MTAGNDEAPDGYSSSINGASTQHGTAGLNALIVAWATGRKP